MRKSFIDIRRQQSNIHFFTLINIYCYFIRSIHNTCHKCRHKFYRIMCFQPSSLISYNSITSRMTFIKSIFCKVCHFIKYFFCCFFWDTIFHTTWYFFSYTIYKIFSFLCHNICFFLAHCSAHQITSP